MALTFLTTIAVLLRILSNPAANVFQKQLTTKGQAPFLVNFLTYFLLSLVCVIISLFIYWQPLPPAFWNYSLIAGLLGALGNGFLVKALQKGDLSILGPINAYKSVVGLITGIFLLHELPGFWGLLGIALIITGSYFVLGTTREGFSWSLLRKSEIQYRLWAMILAAVEAVFIKKIILASSTLIAFFSWCWFGAFFSFLLLLWNNTSLKKMTTSISKSHWWKYLLLITCIGCMQFSTNYTFGHMPVGYALSLFQLSTIISVLLGHRIFQEKEITKKIVGSMVMVAGSVLIILKSGH